MGHKISMLFLQKTTCEDDRIDKNILMKEE